LDVPFVSCSLIANPAGCSSVGSSNPTRINKWNGRRICIQRGGESVLKRKLPLSDESCPQGLLSCGVGCFNATMCPITSLKMVNASTPGAIYLGGNDYLLALRNESNDATPVNKIIIHEDLPCKGNVCRNGRTQLLKDGICDPRLCKFDTRWIQTFSQNETAIYSDHSIPKGMSIGSVKYYFSYRREIIWNRGGRKSSLEDQKFIIGRSDIFPYIPFFYEFAFYLTIVDFIALTVVIPILAFLTDSIRYNFFPERIHISRVDTLNQINLIGDVGSVTIKTLRLAPVGFCFFLSVGFYNFFSSLGSGSFSDVVTNATITEINAKFISIGLILNSLALLLATINLISGTAFLLHALYSDIHFVLLHYEEISRDYSEVPSISGILLRIVLNYKYRIYLAIFDNKRFSFMPCIQKCHGGKNYSKGLRDIDDNEFFCNQYL
jgi:hypothetical protein